ncbi:GTP cyclohydrolase I FolE2 [candidate division WOR-3 bacterium JGI_Cruoil_03_51_56]|uniref:GTP cyclohydrolase FolE2 n=1 Tax=candidate division WOR-3 bacterium JGI_Cruoil_03_51_56 TaxID=1973747 RepID=A0A235BUK0_UNCW3|nr:MAG: GTP cyclohydrolase I FolE2 [candidate division WOR-3 bacterium JGI_Cruoil_03_51_56]
MHDIREQKDTRQVPIDKVGVKGLRYPIVLLDKTRHRQHTIASINMYVNLPQHFRGTHMGRFVEILNRYHLEMDIHKLGTILREMKQRLDAESAHLEMEFPYFIEKKAPVSGVRGLMDYRCWVKASQTSKFRLRIGAAVPVTTLCPCSKEMVKFGGHNQRAEIRVSAELQGFLWLEDLIRLVEDCGSSQIYSLLTREDEKYVTTYAYENPAFVEDVVRNAALNLQNCKEIAGFEVAVESYESIHHHDAYAFISRL